MKDVVIAEIPKMQTTTLLLVIQRFFPLVGLIPDVMLAWVPIEYVIIKGYREIPNSGVREIPTSLQVVLETVDIPKKVEKREMKATAGVLKKPKQQREPKYKQVVIDEDSDDHTHNNVMGEETFLNEDDIAHTSEVPSKKSELIATITTMKVSIPPTSSVKTPLESDVYENILKEHIINISQTPPESEPTSTSIPPLSPASDEYFIVGDEPASLDDFSIPNFNLELKVTMMLVYLLQ
ncbi:unnamed protein product [Lactuca virosa]|uniref:Uncharacterized protein n=1 Tax=Lactuca virosa TaxID=75947 RepID=A0AAU9PVN3_9ASTR|nr:unnamed protein product [Lactuca virosa]